MQSEAFQVLGPLLPVWLQGQINLPKVVRFKKYVDANPALRKQNTLQHSYSLAVLASILLAKLRPYGKLDEGLFFTAVTLHDYGEGELLRDVLFIDKADEKDREEYCAFERRFSSLGEKVWPDLERAFLLQFAGRNPDCFPDHARDVMRCLKQTKQCEISAFEALETWDYLFYPFECYLEEGDELIMAQVLRNQVPRLERFANLIPGFREEIWTDEMCAWCRDFLKCHEHVLFEKKVS